MRRYKDDTYFHFKYVQFAYCREVIAKLKEIGAEPTKENILKHCTKPAYVKTDGRFVAMVRNYYINDGYRQEEFWD